MLDEAFALVTLASSIDDLDGPRLGIDEEYRTRAGGEVHAYLLVDVGLAVVGRADLGGDVGGDSRRAALFELVEGHALVRDVGDVRHEAAPDRTRRLHPKAPFGADLAAAAIVGPCAERSRKPALREGVLSFRAHLLKHPVVDPFQRRFDAVRQNDFLYLLQLTASIS